MARNGKKIALGLIINEIHANELWANGVILKLFTSPIINWYPENLSPKINQKKLSTDYNPNSLDNKDSCWILKDFYCSVTMLRELGLKFKDE